MDAEASVKHSAGPGKATNSKSYRHEYAANAMYAARHPFSPLVEEEIIIIITINPYLVHEFPLCFARQMLSDQQLQLSGIQHY